MNILSRKKGNVVPLSFNWIFAINNVEKNVGLKLIKATNKDNKNKEVKKNDTLNNLDVIV